MAPPPLLPTTRLYACPACREHIKSDTSTCPHCGAELHRESRLARAASAVMVTLALSGCPDKGDDTMGGSGSSTGNTSTGTGTDTTTTGSTTEGNTGTETDSPTVGEPEYGVPQTTSGPEPDYGVPGTTGGPEPDYGVPGTT